MEYFEKIAVRLTFLEKTSVNLGTLRKPVHLERMVVSGEDGRN